MQETVDKIVENIKQLPAGRSTTIKAILGTQMFSHTTLIQISKLAFDECDKRHIELMYAPGYRGYIYNRPFYRVSVEN